jgi:hypothetical protein
LLIPYLTLFCDFSSHFICWPFWPYAYRPSSHVDILCLCTWRPIFSISSFHSLTNNCYLTTMFLFHNWS